MSLKALGTGNSYAVYGEDHPRARLTEKMVMQLRKWLWEERYTMTDIAERYGVHITTVWSAAYGFSWKHLPGALDERRSIRIARQIWGDAFNPKVHNYKGKTNRKSAQISKVAKEFLDNEKHNSGDGLIYVLDRLIVEVQEARGKRRRRSAA